MRDLLDLILVSAAFAVVNHAADVLTRRSHFNAWEREMVS